MKTAIVYASVHHGNTKKIIDEIAKTNDVELIDATEVLQDETTVLEDITEKLQKTNIRFEVTKKIEFLHTTECIS